MFTQSMLNKLDVSKLQAAELARSAEAGATVVNASLQMQGAQRDMKLAGEMLGNALPLSNINKLVTTNMATKDYMVL